MKRIIALILLTALCVSLVACSDSNSKAILGEWKAGSGVGSIKFNEDGTGELGIDGSGTSFTWKYDKELSCYVIATSYYNFNASIKDNGDINYVVMNGTNFYRSDDYDKGIKITLENYRKKIAELSSGKEELQFNTAYTLGDGIIEYTGVSVSEDGKSILLSAAVTNNGTQGDNVSILMPNGTHHWIYYCGGSTNGGGGANWESDDSSWIDPGETKNVVCKVYTFADGVVEDTIDLFGEMVGIVYLEMNEKEYYIELSDYLKK